MEGRGPFPPCHGPERAGPHPLQGQREPFASRSDPKKYVAAEPPLRAKGTEVAMEELALAHEGAPEALAPAGVPDSR
jgi:hypothetical protein